MVANNASALVHYLAGVSPGSIGWLFSPGGFKEPRDWLPYAIDNGKYTCYQNNSVWSEEAYLGLLDRCKLSKHKPKWILVPDEVANKTRTLELWNNYAATLRRLYGWPLAFAAQDGMTPLDVPDDADIVFIGGSTNWKWRNAALFSASFKRIHVGRVNWFDKLEYCERLGVESVDGTGFFRGGENSTQAKQLRDFIEGHRRTHPDLFLNAVERGVS